VLWNPLSFLLKDSIQSNSQTSKESSFGRYQLVKNKGYLVVISKNKGKEQEEDYIDLVPILENLLIDPVPFLDSIKEGKIRYA
jgi:hypothetical protein